MTSGVRLTTKKREHLLRIYLEYGCRAARPLAIQYGINPQHMAQLARDKGLSRRKIALDQARKQINAILAEFRIGRFDLLKSKYPEHVKARAEAIKRLKASGLGGATIAEAMGIDKSTVRYWICPEYRARQLTHYAEIAA